MNSNSQGSNGKYPKLLRTLLYVPGNKEDWIRKSPKYSSDALILDIEDSVPIQEKPIAREIVSRLIGELSAQGMTILVRVNSISSGLTKIDLSNVVQKGLYAISLPMVEGPDDIEQLDKLISVEEEKKSIQEQLNLFKDCNAPCIVFAEVSGSIQGDPNRKLSTRPQMEKDEWQKFCEKISELGKYLEDEGMPLAYSIISAITVGSSGASSCARISNSRLGFPRCP